MTVHIEEDIIRVFKDVQSVKLIDGKIRIDFKPIESKDPSKPIIPKSYLADINSVPQMLIQ